MCDYRISGNPAPQVDDFQDDVTEDIDDNSDVVEAESENDESVNDESVNDELEQDEVEPANSEEADSEITEDVEDEEQDLDNGGNSV